MKIRPFVVGFLVLAVLFLSCGLPKELKERAKGMPERISAQTSQIKSLKNAYSKMQSSSDWGFLAMYAKRENWDGFFTQADSKISEAQNTYDTHVQEILKRNKGKEVKQFRTQLDRVDIQLNEAVSLAKKASQRAEALLAARKNAPIQLATARKETSELSSVYNSLAVKIRGLQNNHPRQQNDLASRLAPVTNDFNKGNSALKTAETQMKSRTPDYAVFVDAVASVKSALASVKKQDKGLRAKVAELDRYYSKTLADMREEYVVVIERCSWDESSDYASEHDYEYAPVIIDEATAATLTPYTGQKVASYANWLGESKKVHGISNAVWSKLHIDWKQGWPSRWDDHAEYYVGEVYERYYHKYIILENGKKSETNWTEVEEDFYENHWDDIGMEIVSKPYGYYEEEKLTQAVPPGMALVGNKEYGQWKKDSDGNSFWEFYGKYAFIRDMMWGPGYSHHYYYNDWNDWDRNYRGRKSYYGKNDNYGTSSKVAKQRYSKTSFARSGGFKSQTSSVRSSGSSARGRGPGSRGK